MKHFQLLLALLTLTLPSAIVHAAPTPTPAPALTGPVTRIDIAGLKNVPEATVRAKLTLKPGDPYTPEAAGKDAAAVQSLGVFLSGTVKPSAAPDPKGGIDVTYTVAEYPIVRGIQFKDTTPSGLPLVPAADLLAQMKTRIGEVLNVNIFVTDMDRLFNLTTGYYLNRGHLASVSTNLDIDPKNGMVTVRLIEYRVKSITATGNSRVKTADILAQMHTKIGSIFSSVTVNEDISDIYETSNFRTVNYTFATANSGDLDLKLSIIEQAPATGTLNEQQGKVIPFRYDPLTASCPVVQVSVNGHSPLPFVVDTGSSAPLLLDMWAAKELSLSVSSKVEKAGNFSFSRVPLQAIVLQGAAAGNNADFDLKEALVTDLSLISQNTIGPRIAGVIGIRLLLPLTSRFDFAAKTLTIFSVPHPPLNIPGATTLPLRSDGEGTFTIRITFAPNRYTDLCLDTGSVGTQLPLGVWDTIHPVAIKFDNAHRRIDSLFIGPELRLSAFALHTLQVPNAVVGIMPSQVTSSLGLNILAGYHLILDGPNGQVLLDPSSHNKRYDIGWSGTRIRPLSKGWVISKLRNLSPAKAAGLQVGDELISIAGVGVRGLSQPLTNRLLDGVVGTRVQVLAQRSNTKIIASWTSVDCFSAPPTAVDGLSLQKANNGPCIVVGLAEGYIDSSARLKVHDRITKVDGEDVASMTADRFVELAGERSLLIEVERAGTAKPFTVTLTAPK